MYFIKKYTFFLEVTSRHVYKPLLCILHLQSVHSIGRFNATPYSMFLLWHQRPITQGQKDKDANCQFPANKSATKKGGMPRSWITTGNFVCSPRGSLRTTTRGYTRVSIHLWSHGVTGGKQHWSQRFVIAEPRFRRLLRAPPKSLLSCTCLYVCASAVRVLKCEPGNQDKGGWYQGKEMRSNQAGVIKWALARAHDSFVSKIMQPFYAFFFYSRSI